MNKRWAVALEILGWWVGLGGLAVALAFLMFKIFGIL